MDLKYKLKLGLYLLNCSKLFKSIDLFITLFANLAKVKKRILFELNSFASGATAFPAEAHVWQALARTKPQTLGIDMTHHALLFAQQLSWPN